MPIVITEMIVARDREWLDPSVDEELRQDTLELCLPRLEVVTTDKGLVLLREFDDTGNECILGRPVDEGCTFEDRRDGEDGARRDLVVRMFDRRENGLCSIIDTRDNLAVSLRIRGPEYDDLVKVVGGLEFANILTDMLKMSCLVGAGDDVISTFFLVGSDIVRIVDGRQRSTELLHVRCDLTL